MSNPILYSYRRCPYAIRARLALKISHIEVQTIEISLRNKPQDLLKCSAKGTVPVLKISPETVIDESLDIMLWALRQHDPEAWLENGKIAPLGYELIQENDGPFKIALDRYKYPERFHHTDTSKNHENLLAFITKLEQQLIQHTYLISDKVTIADMAIMPFIRQFAKISPTAFASLPYPRLINWLETLTTSEIFSQVMQKPTEVQANF